jgi:hypothetical protein
MKGTPIIAALLAVVFLSFQWTESYHLRAMRRWQSAISKEAAWEEVDSTTWRCRQEDGEAHLLVLRRVNTCTFGGCIRPDSPVKASAGQEYLVYGAHLDGITGAILELRVLEYASSYGYQMTAKWWLKQFKQWTGTEAEIQAVDGITGATVSVNAFVDDLKALVLEHRDHSSNQ